MFALLVCCAAWIISLLSCSKPIVAGGGADIGNPQARVSGRALYPGGKSVAGAVVRLRTDRFLLPLPGQTAQDGPVYNTVTDDSGRYSIDSVDSGSYFLEVNDRRSSALLAACTVGETMKSVDAGTDTCRPYATIAGTVDLSVKPQAKRYVQVDGLERLAPVDSSGNFTLNDLPGATYELRVACADSTVAASDIRGVTAMPGNITDIPRVGWSFSKKLFLNTTASGAGISGNVYGFPVLVRLTSGVFDFGLAQTGGGDIRFTKPDNSPLPYEIERWDASAGAAEIWVRVDTVFGNDSTHYITMFWGNKSAASLSNSRAVFDTAAGFQGVWHLSEPGNTTVYDATANHFDGAPSGMSSASAVAGTIGIAQGFNGISSGITLPNTAAGKLDYYGNGNYSFSAWVYTDTLDSLSQPIVAKGDYQYALQIRYTSEFEFFIYKDSVWQFTRSSASAGTWKYIVGVRENDAQYLFIDGALVSGTVTVLVETPKMPDDTTRNVTIGFLPEMNRFFNGMIDEVRVENVPLSADWILLCYANQKANDALVVFK
jgi:hypothetical protein